MTGAHDETDAVFVERMANEMLSEGFASADLERLIRIARAHATPRTVQAAVTDEQARKAGDVIWMALTRRMVDSGTADDFAELARAALKAAASVPTAAPEPELFLFIYRNWRGEMSSRCVIFKDLHWGSTEWHPEPQWLMRAHDLDKNEEREFAVADMRPIGGTHDVPTTAPLEERQWSTIKPSNGVWVCPDCDGVRLPERLRGTRKIRCSTCKTEFGEAEWMPTDPVSPEPASFAACSCGDLAYFVDDDVVAAMKAYNIAIFQNYLNDHDAMVDAVEAFLVSIRSRHSAPMRVLPGLARASGGDRGGKLEEMASSPNDKLS